MIGSSLSFLDAVERASAAAALNRPVLVIGERGTGKELIADRLHRLSPRWSQALVSLNCAALPENLIDAELFGYEPGAFTGAQRARAGRFEDADGGTLFLDEIGNLPPAGQMKLLRVLETGRFTRLGSNKEKQVKVRVISATNADLPAMIRDGRFREDLYYRLNVIEIRIPPLAERPRDILPLAQSFLTDGKSLSDGAVHSLLRHAWPGHVRELKNVMQRACLLSSGPLIQAGDLGLPVVAAPAAGSQGNDAELDRGSIEQALARAGGVVAQAASDLGLSRQALYRRMERLGIARP